MANEEQLAILRQGVAAWNIWREENPDAKIDLSGAELDKMDLRGVNFRNSNLINVNFDSSILGTNSQIDIFLIKKQLLILITLNQ